MKRTIKLWAKRNLSIYGKVLVAKTFIISQFIYTMQSIGIPDDILIKINRELFAFIRKKKYNKKAFEMVKHKILTQDIDKGGLKMIDMKTLQEALYLTWIPKLVNRQEKHNIWMAYPPTVFSQIGLNLDILVAPAIYQHTSLVYNNICLAFGAMFFSLGYDSDRSKTTTQNT